MCRGIRIGESLAQHHPRDNPRRGFQLDRDNPEPKDFGKLVWRGGLNFFANSPYFGGFSALAIDPSGKTILAISDAGIWLRGTIDYDKRKMKGLSNGRDRPAAWH